MPPIDVAAIANRIIANIEKVIIGKRPQLTLAVAAYFCEGHILLEDVPGVAKTMFARALARSVGCTFKRLQCTPDLLPTDVTGVSIFNQKTAEFEFRPGPVFAQTLLADEINRATPRTQAALLEAMAERRVSVDGQTYVLKPPFLVIATQNPIDQEGHVPAAGGAARPLPHPPEPRLPEHGGRRRRCSRGCRQATRSTTSKPVVTADDVIACQEAIRDIHVDDKVKQYILEIVHASREHEDVLLGGSPRASIALFRTAQALAAVTGRDFALPDDVKKMAQPVLAHRLILKPESRLRKRTAGRGGEGPGRGREGADHRQAEGRGRKTTSSTKRMLVPRRSCF